MHTHNIPTHMFSALKRLPQKSSVEELAIIVMFWALANFGGLSADRKLKREMDLDPVRQENSITPWLADSRAGKEIIAGGVCSGETETILVYHIPLKAICVFCETFPQRTACIALAISIPT